MKLLIYCDPLGTHSKISLKKYSPEDIFVWENDSRHVYTINQINAKINVIADLDFVKHMHFSETIANPPYLKNLHLEFLLKALKISDSVRIIHPAGWLFRSGRDIERKVKEALKGRVKKLTLFNGNTVFEGAEFDCPLVITEAVESHEGPIEVHYKSSGKTYYINSLNEMPSGFWEPTESMLDIVKKYQELTEFVCLNDLVTKKFNPSGNRVFVQPPRTCGHAKTNNPETFCTADFYTFFYRNSDIWTLKEKEPCYSLNNQEEAESLVSYMKTKFARFGLAIHKISRDSYLSRYLSNVPIPPLDRQWTEESIMEHYCMTPEQVEFINNFIPDYYEKEQAQ